MRTYLKPLSGLVLLALAGTSVWYASTLGYTIDLSMLKMYRMDIEAFLMQQYVTGVLLFMLVYVVVVTFSVPIASLLTVLAGFLFGSVAGTAAVALAATLGATLAFLLNRFLFADFISERFGARLGRINAELRSAGLRDIVIVRLTPIFSFSLVTVAAALTQLRLRDFVIGTFVGILPFTFIYVHAGTQLATVEQISDIVSWPVLIGVSLLVLAVSIPLVITHRQKRAVERDTHE